jgi:hypothetical protein
VAVRGEHAEPKSVHIQPQEIAPDNTNLLTPGLLSGFPPQSPPPQLLFTDATPPNAGTSEFLDSVVPAQLRTEDRIMTADVRAIRAWLAMGLGCLALLGCQRMSSRTHSAALSEGFPPAGLLPCDPAAGSAAPATRRRPTAEIASSYRSLLGAAAEAALTAYLPRVPEDGIQRAPAAFSGGLTSLHVDSLFSMAFSAALGTLATDANGFIGRHSSCTSLGALSSACALVSAGGPGGARFRRRNPRGSGPPTIRQPKAQTS